MFYFYPQIYYILLDYLCLPKKVLSDRSRKRLTQTEGHHPKNNQRKQVTDVCALIANAVTE